MTNTVYEPNPKHKPGTSGDGPPRWFPSSDSICPDDITVELAQQMLEGSVPGEDATHPDSKARYAILDGRFFKGYQTEVRAGIEVWHGYPVSRELVGEQVPARVLREFRKRGQLTNAEYKKLVGSAK